MPPLTRSKSGSSYRGSPASTHSETDTGPQQTPRRPAKKASKTAPQKARGKLPSLSPEPEPVPLDDEGVPLKDNADGSDWLVPTVKKSLGISEKRWRALREVTKIEAVFRRRYQRDHFNGAEWEEFCDEIIRKTFTCHRVLAEKLKCREGHERKMVVDVAIKDALKKLRTEMKNVGIEKPIQGQGAFERPEQYLGKLSQSSQSPVGDAIG